MHRTQSSWLFSFFLKFKTVNGYFWPLPIGEFPKTPGVTVMVLKIQEHKACWEAGKLHSSDGKSVESRTEEVFQPTYPNFSPFGQEYLQLYYLTQGLVNWSFWTIYLSVIQSVVSNMSRGKSKCKTWHFFSRKF